MASYDLFSYGCSDVNESSLHFCADAVSIEKSINVKSHFNGNYNSLNANASDSTNTGTNEGQNPSGSTEVEPINFFGINQFDFVLDDDENIFYPEIAYPVEQMSCELEVGVRDPSTPITEDFVVEESRVMELNLNKMNAEEECIEEESTTSKAPQQSQFKNKPKELLEKAVAIFKYFAGLKENGYNAIVRENLKSYEEWMMDGEVISEMIQVLETQVNSGNDKQAKKTKKAILAKLEAKQYCCFSGLHTFMQRIQQCESQVIANFNQDYKKKVSQAFFKTTNFESNDLFSWILLLQIALVILPSDNETLQLLPLKKESVFLNAWMFQSPMNEENKNLYRGSYVRNHLKNILGEAKAALMKQAEAKMEIERLRLLKEVCSALAGGVESCQRNQRPMYSIIGLRPAVNYESMGTLTGKRSSNLYSMKSEKITKKVNKNRK